MLVLGKMRDFFEFRKKREMVNFKQEGKTESGICENPNLLFVFCIVNRIALLFLSSGTLFLVNCVALLIIHCTALLPDI